MWSWERGGTRSGQGCVLVRIERRDREGRFWTKKDHATATAEKATRGGGRTPPTVANLGGPGFTTDEIRRVKVTGRMGACRGRTVGTGVRDDAYAAQPSRAASVRDARRET